MAYHKTVEFPLPDSVSGSRLVSMDLIIFADLYLAPDPDSSEASS
jgi:hypothetical protein